MLEPVLVVPQGHWELVALLELLEPLVLWAPLEFVRHVMVLCLVPLVLLEL